MPNIDASKAVTRTVSEGTPASDGPQERINLLLRSLSTVSSLADLRAKAAGIPEVTEDEAEPTRG